MYFSVHVLKICVFYKFCNTREDINIFNDDNLNITLLSIIYIKIKRSIRVFKYMRPQPHSYKKKGDFGKSPFNV